MLAINAYVYIKLLITLHGLGAEYYMHATFNSRYQTKKTAFTLDNLHKVLLLITDASENDAMLFK